MSVTYWIDAGEVKTLVEKLFIEIPEVAIEDIKREVAQVAKSYIQAEAPTSFGKESQHTGTPLWTTVTIDIVGDGYSVGPTKKVSGHWDLASILTFGSAGGTVITPRNAKYLKFYYKGKTWFKKSVIRGTTPINSFVGRAKEKLDSQIPSIVRSIFMRKLLEVK